MPQAHLRTLGLNIRSLRKQQRLTQEDVADQAHLNASYYGRIERGEINVTVETLHAIATALNVPIADFFASEMGTVDLNRLRKEIDKLVKKLDSHQLRLIRDLLLLPTVK
jgi:XRE family transcriptional regulator, regulator of sulfur utilization